MHGDMSGNGRAFETLAQATPDGSATASPPAAPNSAARDSAAGDSTNLGDALSGARAAILAGQVLPGIRVVESTAALARLDAAQGESAVLPAGVSLRAINLPKGAAALARFVAEWHRRHAAASKLGVLSMLVLPIAACGGGGGGASGGTDGGSGSYGYIIDGYIAGASVSQDDVVITTSAGDGSFDMALIDPTKPIVITGGTDITTGLPFTGTLTAPGGSTVVTPLTTLIQSLATQGGGDYEGDVAGAMAFIQAAFGLGGTNILDTDPIATGDNILFGAGVRVASLLSLAIAAGGDAGAAADGLAAALAAGTFANLGAATGAQLAAALGVDSSLADALEGLVALLGTATTYDQIVAAQTYLQGAVAAQVKAIAEQGGTPDFGDIGVVDDVDDVPDTLSLTKADSAADIPGLLAGVEAGGATVFATGMSAAQLAVIADAITKIADDGITGLLALTSGLTASQIEALLGKAADSANVVANATGMDSVQLQAVFDNFDAIDGLIGDIEVEEGGTLTLTAALADERTIAGEGAVVVTGLADDTDLSGLHADLDVTATVTADLDITANDDLGPVDTYTVATGATLTLTAAQANGKAITGDGAVEISGDVGADTDLTDIAAGLVFEDDEIDVAESATLTLTAAQADGKAITGDGGVEISGDVGADTDLTDITAALSFAEDPVEVTAGILTLTAAQADELAITGAGDVAVTGLDDTQVDLSGLAVTGEMRATLAGDTVTLHADTDLGDVAVTVETGQALTLTAGQADGSTLTGGGAVTVTGLGAATDLSGLEDGLDVTTTVTGDLDVSENPDLGPVDAYTVVADATLTLSAAQADGRAITGAGNVVVTGLDDADIDLSQIAVTGTMTAAVTATATLAEATDLGDFAVTVDEGQTLTLNAAQADGVAITGLGGVTVTGLGGDAVDLAEITVTGSKIVEVTADATLHEDTQLAGFSVEVSDTVTLTLSAAQASGRAITGDGDVVISGAVAADTDLTTVTAGLSFEGDPVEVGEGFTLTLTATQADGIAITGAGSVVISGDVTASADLSGITAALSFEGNAIAVSAAQTLTLTAAQAGDAVITGEGTVSLSGDATADGGAALDGIQTSLIVTADSVLTLDTAQLGEFHANAVPVAGPGSVALTGEASELGDLSLLVTADLAVPEGGELTLTAAQADGLVLSVSGTLTITGLDDTETDLSNITIEDGGTATVTVTGSPTLDEGTDLGEVTLSIGVGQTVTADAGQIDGKTVTGDGTLAVTGDVDLGEIDFGGLSVAVIDLTGAELTGVTLSLPDVSEIHLTYEQANDLTTIGGTGGANYLVIDVSGAPFAGDPPTAEITVNISTLGGNDTVIFDFGAGSDARVIVLSDTSVIALGDGENALIANNGTVDISQATVTGVSGVTINSTLVLSADQFVEMGDDLSDLQGAGELQIIVGAEFDGVLDLSNLAFTTGGSTPPTVRIDASANAGFVAEGEDAQIILPTDPDSPVIVLFSSDGEDYIFLGEFAPGRQFFSEITTVFNATQLGDLVQAIVDDLDGVAGTEASDVEAIRLGASIILTGDVDLTAANIAGVDLDYDGRTITVTGGSTLTLTAAQADGGRIVGAGNVLITGLADAPDANLSGIVAAGATVVIDADFALGGSANLGSLAVTVEGDATLTLSAAQASGKSISGDGDVVITGLGAAAVNLSGITAAASATVSGTLSLSSLTNLGTVALVLAEGADLALSRGQLDGRGVELAADADSATLRFAGDATGIDLTHVDAGIDYRVVAGRTLTVTAAQADGRSIDGGGSVHVTGLGGAEADLSGVAVTGTKSVAVTADATLHADTDLGAFALTVASGAELSLSADQAADRSIAGAGDVTVTGLGGDAVSLTGITVTGARVAEVEGEVVLSGATQLGGFALRVEDGAELTLSVTQASGRAITGEGDVVVTGLGAAPVNLSGIAADGTATAEITGTVTLAAGTQLGTVAIEVAESATLTLSAAQAHGAAISGPGNVTVTGLAAGTDLSDVDPAGTLTVTVTAARDITGNGNLDSVDAFLVTGSLTLTAAQADGTAIAGTRPVTVNGLADGTNLAAVTTTGPVTATVTGTIDITGNDTLGSVDVFAVTGALTLTAAQADGTAITGTGQVIIDGLAAGTDLAAVTTFGTVTATVTGTIDITGNENVGSVDVFAVIGSLALTGAQADGRSITGEGDVTITVAAAADGIDLSGLDVDGTVAVTVLVDLDISGNVTVEGIDTVDVAAGATLTLSAAQAASGVVVTGEGNVAISGLGTESVDFTGIQATGTLTAAIAGTVTLAPGSVLGDVDLTLAEGGSLTLTGAQASGRGITGAGDLTITGVAGGIDLAGLDVAGSVTATVTSSINVSGNATISGIDFVTIAASRTLTMSAEQATSGVVVTGAGNVTVTGLGDEPVDFTGIQAGGALVASVAGLVTLHGDSDLGGFALSVGAGSTLTLTAAQADGLAVTGTGTVIVTGDPQGFDLSGIAETLTLELPDAGTFLTIGEGETVHLTVAQALAYDEITGTGTLALTGNVTEAFETLAGIIGEELLLAVPAGGSLILTAAQADGLALSGTGTVVVTGEAADVDFTEISASLDISGATLTGTPALPELAAGQTLTLTAEQADGTDIAGEGTVVIGGSFSDAFDAVETGASQAPGVWYTDRYAPGGFEVDTETFEGNSVLKHSISAADGADGRPAGQLSGAFYDTQGRKFDVPEGTKTMSVDLYIDPDWAPGTGEASRWAGFWGVVASTGELVYPIIEFATVDGIDRFRVWDSGTQDWHDLGLPDGFEYGQFQTLTITVQEDGSFHHQVGALTHVTGPFEGASEIGNVILQGHNGTQGRTYDIFWDNLEAGPSVFIGEDTDLSQIEAVLAFADDTIVVAPDATLTLTAEQASGLTIAGDGNVTIIGVGGDTDLSGIAVAGTVAVIVAGDVDITGNETLASVDAYAVTAGTLTLTAGQANGTAITGEGTVVIGGDVSADADLTGVATTLAFTGVVGADATLTLTAAQADGLELSGAGTAQLLGDAAGVDLRGISANLDLTGATLAETTQLPVLADGQTLTLTVEQANGTAITGEGTVVIGGDVSADADLTGVATTLAFTGVVGADATLTLTAAQADGLTVGGEGTVLISGTVSADADFSGITATLAFGDSPLPVTDGAMLSLTAAQVDGAAIDLAVGATLFVDVSFDLLSTGNPALPSLDIAGITVDGSNSPMAVWDAIEVSGTEADKFKLFWVTMDQQYYAVWPDADVTVNEAFVELGNLYAEYLQNGGDAILDIVQTKVSGVPDFDARQQSLHDNILANLQDNVIASRFGENDPRNDAAKAFGDRPESSGTNPTTFEAARLWDYLNGVAREDAYSQEDGVVSVFSGTTLTGSFGTIQAAIAAAEAGDTLLIGAGTFAENLTVGKSLDIRAADGAILEGRILVTADMTLQGLEIVTPGQYGIRVAGTDVDVSLTNVDISKADAAGGQILGVEAQAGATPSITVTGGSFTGLTTGIYLNPGAGLSVDGATFTGNLAGIGTEGPATLVVTGSTFENTLEGIGLTAGTSIGEAQISGNTFVGEGQIPIANGGLDTGLTELSGTNVTIVAAGQSIQAAINAAQAGDTILVGPGVYEETLDFRGKVLTLLGPKADILAGNHEGARGVDSSVGEAVIVGTAHLVDSVTDVTLAGFYLDVPGKTVGSTDVGKLFGWDRGPTNTANDIQAKSLTLENNVIKTAVPDQAFFYGNHQDLVLINNTFSNFTRVASLDGGPGASEFVMTGNAVYGGAAAVIFGGNTIVGGATITDNLFVGGSSGAIIALGNDGHTIADNVFTSGGGSAITFFAAGVGNTITGNDFSAHIGQALGLGGATSSLSDSTITDNIFGEVIAAGTVRFSIGPNSQKIGELETFFDTINFGTAGADTIEGTDGNDLLFGGAGADILIGGAGADTFVFRSSDALGVGDEVMFDLLDRVVDFDATDGDSIALTTSFEGLVGEGGVLDGAHYAEFADLNAALAAAGAGDLNGAMVVATGGNDGENDGVVLYYTPDGSSDLNAIAFLSGVDLDGFSNEQITVASQTLV